MSCVKVALDTTLHLDLKVVKNEEVRKRWRGKLGGKFGELRNVLQKAERVGNNRKVYLDFVVSIMFCVFFKPWSLAAMIQCDLYCTFQMCGSTTN